jgi:hypothetical protein
MADEVVPSFEFVVTQRAVGHAISKLAGLDDDAGLQLQGAVLFDVRMTGQANVLDWIADTSTATTLVELGPEARFVVPHGAVGYAVAHVATGNANRRVLAAVARGLEGMLTAVLLAVLLQARNHLALVIGKRHRDAVEERTVYDTVTQPSPGDALTGSRAEVFFGAGFVESVIAVRVAVADLLPDHSLDDCRIVLPGKRFFLAVGHAAFESRVIDQANVCVLVLAGLAVLDAVAQLVVADESTHAVLALPAT